MSVSAGCNAGRSFVTLCLPLDSMAALRQHEVHRSGTNLLKWNVDKVGNSKGFILFMGCIKERKGLRSKTFLQDYPQRFSVSALNRAKVHVIR